MGCTEIDKCIISNDNTNLNIAQFCNETQISSIIVVLADFMVGFFCFTRFSCCFARSYMQNGLYVLIQHLEASVSDLFLKKTTKRKADIHLKFEHGSGNCDQSSSG